VSFVVERAYSTGHGHGVIEASALLWRADGKIPTPITEKESRLADFSRFLEWIEEVVADVLPGDLRDSVGLEIALPFDLLSWADRLNTGKGGSQRVLGTRYPVVVRSLERFRDQGALLGDWRRRWLLVHDENRPKPSEEMIRVYDLENVTGIAKDLRHAKQVCCVGLTFSPSKDHPEVIEALVAAGIPAALWLTYSGVDPAGRQSLREELRNFLTQTPVQALPEVVLRLRRDAASAFIPAARPYLGSHLILLWEDPTRTTSPRHPSSRLRTKRAPTKRRRRK
jgi:hypothetical protein